jgi:hypothetical protein
MKALNMGRKRRTYAPLLAALAAQVMSLSARTTPVTLAFSLWLAEAQAMGLSSRL